MSGGDIMGQLRALRDQIEKDTTVGVGEIEERKQRAFTLLEEIEKNDLLPSNAKILVQQLRRSVSDFYTLLFNRSWTKKFALDDILELEKRCAPPGESKDSKRGDTRDRWPGADGVQNGSV